MHKISRTVLTLLSLRPHSNSVLYWNKPITVFPALPILLVSKMSTDSKDDLKKRLTAVQYSVTQEKGTERPFTGCYNKFNESGMYVCIVCEQELFSSENKYDSGCGWPAFNNVVNEERVNLSPDTSIVGANLLLLISQPGRIRTEVTCSKCGAHLGHVFDDGPAPTKKRFCINSASMDFKPEKNVEKS